MKVIPNMHVGDDDRVLVVMMAGPEPSEIAEEIRRRLGHPPHVEFEIDPNDPDYFIIKAVPDEKIGSCDFPISSEKELVDILNIFENNYMKMQIGKIFLEQLGQIGLKIPTPEFISDFIRFYEPPGEEDEEEEGE